MLHIRLPAGVRSRDEHTRLRLDELGKYGRNMRLPPPGLLKIRVGMPGTASLLPGLDRLCENDIAG